MSLFGGSLGKALGTVFNPIGAASTSILGGILGGGGDGGAGRMDRTAMDMRKKAYQDIMDVEGPRLNDVQYNLLPTSKLEGLRMDAGLTNTRQGIIDRLGQVANNKGPDARASYQMQGLLNRVNQNARGQREATMQSLRSRGMGNSGLALLGRMKGAQDASQMANMQGMGIAADNERRAMQALGMQGDAARALSNDKLGLHTTQANARDRVNQFNTQLINREQDMNRIHLPQQRYDNRMQKATTQANAANGVANAYNKMAGAAAAGSGGMMKGIIGGATTGATVGGPWGALIGGALGALGGGMSDQRNRNRYRGM